MTDPQTCAHVKDDGSRCQMRNNIADNGLCIWHDPERRDVAKEMRATGQRRAVATKKASRAGVVPRTVDPGETPGPPPETLEEALTWASWAMAAVATGAIDARTAHEIGFLCRAFMDGQYRLSRTDERVRELQQKLKVLAGGKR